MDVTTHRERRTALDERLDAARASGGFDPDRAWSLSAGLSAGYVKTQRHRASLDPAHRMPEDGAADLARAAGVNVTWLRTGVGELAAESPAPIRVVPSRASPPSRLALVEALRRNPERYTSEDFLAALDVTRGSETMLPDDPEGAVTTMARVLSAVSRLRREGKPVTFEAVFWTLADSAAADAANAEGLAQLRALGGEPPREPVKTPPRGVAAVPSAPKPLKS